MTGVRVIAHGTRGSLPASGPDYARYGGATISLEMRCGDEVLLFDAGSGILPAGKALVEEGVGRMNLFLTHCHYDHMIGLPYFKPLYDAGNDVTLWSGHMHGNMTTRQIVDGFIRAPWFPVGTDVCGKALRCRDFRPGEVLTPAPGISIRTGSLVHPGGAVGYRVDFAGKAVAVVTDTEHEPGTLDPEVLRLIAGADLFFYDCTYTDEEMATYRGFGHSSWQQGIRLAEAAGAAQVAFLHHAPWRKDAALAEIDRLAAARFAGAACARDGQVYEV